MALDLAGSLNIGNTISNTVGGIFNSSDTISPQLPSNVTDVLHTITANDGILGAVAIGVGFYFLILGFKLYKPTMFLMGFVAGAIAGYSALMHFRPAGGYPSDSNVIMYGSGALGLMTGSLLLCIIKLGIAIIGGVGGLFLSLFILGLRDFGVIEYGTGRTIFICACVLVGIISAFFLEKHVVIVATSFVGGYGICFGIDCFAKVGFRTASEAFLSSGNSSSLVEFQTNPKVIALCVSILVLTLGGVLIQYRINGGRKRHGD
ncbi:hypothetical protein BDR26DRAFT_855849 [Obelidium mucronatum]|nr:hypothetical protein BDR26DRAFT_855849 [Obelidium mucronatum]